MTVYTYAQMEQLWIQAATPRLGASAAKALAPIAAAIGEAESGGNSDALNPNDNNGTQSSFGIWQISTGTHTPPAPNWANPAVNAQLAVDKFVGAGHSWSPWGTYDSGAYRAFLSGKIPPDTNVPGSPTQQATQTAYQASKDCLLGNPFSASVGLGPFSVGGSIGPSCLFTKSNARAFIGAGFLVAGAVIFITGEAWVAAGAALHVFGVPSGLPKGPWYPQSTGTGPWQPPASSGTSGSLTAEQVPASGAASSAGAVGGPKVIQGTVLESTTEAAPLAIAAA